LHISSVARGLRNSAQRDAKSTPPHNLVVVLFIDSAIQKFGDNLLSAVLFGSVARGDNDAESDVDLLLVFKELPKSRLERGDMVDEARSSVEPLLEYLRGLGFKPEVNTVALTAEEASKSKPLYLDLAEDAIVIVDKDYLFTRVLDKEGEIERARVEEDLAGQEEVVLVIKAGCQVRRNNRP